MQVKRALCQKIHPVTTSIPINFDLGRKLKSLQINQSKISPNLYLKNYLRNNESYINFTDSSKIPGAKSVGAACTCPNLKYSSIVSLNANTSIFTAECIAIYNALNIPIDKAQETKVLIFVTPKVFYLAFKHLNLA